MFSGMCWPALCAAFETTYATFRARGDVSVCKLPLNTWYVYYENTEDNYATYISLMQGKILRLLPERFLR